ncbi:SCP-like extracellular protein [Haloferula helveola]|uniref:SCP-like extracellular protein n=1 Tax=Haloferula helveola TaxID=490095 RepID=A0ABM7RKD6_9BACT|nr:SCP-like extracellular protein [Haloferula helveola]
MAATLLGTLSNAWSGTGPVPSTGLTVDTTDRNAVLAFWNSFYGASQNSASVMAWSGSYGSTCDPGTNSLAYTEAIERRVNFYRALAGIHGNVVVNSGAPVVIFGTDAHQPPATTTKTEAAQWAALMFSYAGQINHNPPPAQPYSCWSSRSWNGASKSNLAIGFHGPDAIDAYLRENDPNTLSIWSTTVGHRRWILMQSATDFASGDVPGNGGSRQPTNVLYVVPSFEELIAVTPKFVSWPSAGYFPDQLMAKQWSVSYPGADFSNATVSMTDENGSTVSTSIVDRTTLGFGEPTIIWSVPDSVAAPSVSADTSYHVTVSGIVVAGQTVAHSYSTTVFDPDVLDVPLELVGTATPPVDGANYFFEPVPAAEQHSVIASVSETASWTEGAEDGESDHIVDGTDPVYELRSSSGLKRSGAKAFRLGFPAAGAPPQWFEIDREVVPLPGCELRYYVRRGFMQAATKLEVQFSTDGNLWATVDTLNGKSTNSLDDSSFNLRTVPMSSASPVRVRFVMSHGGGAVNVVGQHNSVGVFIDDITVSNAEWVSTQVEIPAATAAGMVRLDPGSIGSLASEGQQLKLRLSASLGGRPYLSSEQLAVTFTGGIGGFSDWIAAEYPQVSGGFGDDHDGDGLENGVEYAFGLSPIAGSQLSRSLILSGGQLQLRTPLSLQRPGVSYEMETSPDLSIWSTSGSTVIWNDGELVGSSALPAGKGFARWKITEN